MNSIFLRAIRRLFFLSSEHLGQVDTLHNGIAPLS